MNKEEKEWKKNKEGEYRLFENGHEENLKIKFGKIVRPGSGGNFSEDNEVAVSINGTYCFDLRKFSEAKYADWNVLSDFFLFLVGLRTEEPEELSGSENLKETKKHVLDFFKEIRLPDFSREEKRDIRDWLKGCEYGNFFKFVNGECYLEEDTKTARNLGFQILDRLRKNEKRYTDFVHRDILKRRIFESENSSDPENEKSYVRLRMEENDGYVRLEMPERREYERLKIEELAIEKRIEAIKKLTA